MPVRTFLMKEPLEEIYSLLKGGKKGEFVYNDVYLVFRFIQRQKFMAFDLGRVVKGVFIVERSGGR